MNTVMTVDAAGPAGAHLAARGTFTEGVVR